MRCLAFLVLVLALFPALATTGVERVEITTREPLLDGMRFGDTGAYEVIRGRLHLAVDPEAPINAAIVDLKLAARGEDGLVRFATDFYLMRPLEPGKGNGSLMVDIPNRGGDTLSAFNFSHWPSIDNPESWPPSGEGYLLRKGFTLLGIAWQQDVPQGNTGRMIMDMVTVSHDGKPVTGLVRSDFVPDTKVETMFLGHWGHVPYPNAIPDDARNVLTVRTSELAEREVIPKDRWRFGRIDAGELVADKTAIVLDGGFQPGLFYEIIYMAEAPRVMGLGFAAVRDGVSHFRYQTPDLTRVDRAVTFGASQSGRFLRHFLYQGFNLDAKNRLVFDGVFSSVAGGGRGSFNHRFAQPSRATTHHFASFYPTDIFPFTGQSLRDPISGREDGLLKRYPPDKRPKVMYFNSGWEYWGRAGSLVHTTPDGTRDLSMLPEERVYYVASSQHFPSTIAINNVVPLPVATLKSAYPLNLLNIRVPERALMDALDAWVSRDQDPPPSQFPQLGDKTLVKDADLAFPAIPGVTRVPPYFARLIDYGPRWLDQGIIDTLPPKIGTAYGVRVPQVDSDGNELAGIRMPEITVPLGTYTGWNLRHPDQGAPTEAVAMIGSFFPFALTKESREKTGDPRLSIAERYHSKDEYLGKFMRAAADLVRSGYLLAEDLPFQLRHAEKLWDLIHRENIVPPFRLP